MGTATGAKTTQVTQMESGHQFKERTDVYFSADVETDGPIPGPFSILSFALVFAGSFDGTRFSRPQDYRRCSFYVEMRPISQDFQPEALRVNGLDRERLCSEGRPPEIAMDDAANWVRRIAGEGRPVLVAYPLSFDWSWLYWYFVRFAKAGSPFRHSSCFDIKTAIAVKGHLPISLASRPNLSQLLRSEHRHTHNALDDAAEQAEIFANVFEWEGDVGNRT
jgi:DNA polymerase III epsilon subunit-like protein